MHSIHLCLDFTISSDGFFSLPLEKVIHYFISS